MELNSREKFLSVMRMQDGDYGEVQVPKVEFGYWAGTIRKWFDQGLTKIQDIPEDISDGSGKCLVTNSSLSRVPLS